MKVKFYKKGVKYSLNLKILTTTGKLYKVFKVFGRLSIIFFMSSDFKFFLFILNNIYIITVIMCI